MKLCLFLVIFVYKCSNYYSCVEYDLADSSQVEKDFTSPFVYDQEKDGDYISNNGLVFEFRRSIKSDNTEIEARRRSALDKNFMRFGRSDPTTQQRAVRANLMRFGRADRGFLRFGKTPNGVPYSLVGANNPKDDSDDSSEETTFTKRTPNSSEETEISESGEQIKPKQLVQFRRESPKNLMRFGKRGEDDDFVRVNRANLMRFGRAGNGSNRNMLRFGRASANMMRFGRAKGNLMRFGRSDPRFLRLVKMDNNFMRFGRSDKSLKPTNNNKTHTSEITADDSEDAVIDSTRLATDKYDTSLTKPSDDDYEVYLREEDILVPVHVSNH
ncbi:FMRFamide-related neuropeptides isoform X2 [Toxorhynchites rutilus septentrionalis]|nr:FMRFamide-related neuropeptides isoform X2 [Toxorhynchites rutilus septentrionalis]